RARSRPSAGPGRRPGPGRTGREAAGARRRRRPLIGHRWGSCPQSTDRRRHPGGERADRWTAGDQLFFDERELRDVRLPPERLVVPPRLAGALARFSASFSTAMVSVISSTVSIERSDTLAVPSVMYGPKRPSLITIGFSLVGSVPSSFSGGLAAARPRRLGWAYSFSASSRVMVNICSSVS